MMEYQPLRYWKVSYIDESGLPYVATFKTRKQARACKKFFIRYSVGKPSVYKCSLQNMGGGIMIEVSEKVS